MANASAPLAFVDFPGGGELGGVHLSEPEDPFLPPLQEFNKFAMIVEMWLEFPEGEDVPPLPPEFPLGPLLVLSISIKVIPPPALMLLRELEGFEDVGIGALLAARRASSSCFAAVTVSSRAQGVSHSFGMQRSRKGIQVET